jgi:hypothetical protein
MAGGGSVRQPYAGVDFIPQLQGSMNSATGETGQVGKVKPCNILKSRTWMQMRSKEDMLNLPCLVCSYLGQNRERRSKQMDMG